MRKSLLVLGIFGVMSAPAVAQTAPATAPAAQQKPQTVKKVVCERVDAEETTGSRLGTAPKRCKTVEVPVKGDRSAHGQHAPAPANATGNNF